MKSTQWWLRSVTITVYSLSRSQFSYITVYNMCTEYLYSGRDGGHQVRVFCSKGIRGCARVFTSLHLDWRHFKFVMLRLPFHLGFL